MGKKMDQEERDRLITVEQRLESIESKVDLIATSVASLEDKYVTRKEHELQRQLYESQVRDIRRELEEEHDKKMKIFSAIVALIASVSSYIITSLF